MVDINIEDINTDKKVVSYCYLCGGKILVDIITVLAGTPMVCGDKRICKKNIDKIQEKRLNDYREWVKELKYNKWYRRLWRRIFG